MLKIRVSRPALVFFYVIFWLNNESEGTDTSESSSRLAFMKLPGSDVLLPILVPESFDAAEFAENTAKSKRQYSYNKPKTPLPPLAEYPTDEDFEAELEKQPDSVSPEIEAELNKPLPAIGAETMQEIDSSALLPDPLPPPVKDTPSYEINPDNRVPRIPGTPGLDYPTYIRPPHTDFKCPSTSGYYGDVEARCQSFHVCLNSKGLSRQYSFLCPNGTVFSQRDFVCVWWYDFDCEITPTLTYLNKYLQWDNPNLSVEQKMANLAKMTNFGDDPILAAINRENFPQQLIPALSIRLPNNKESFGTLKSSSGVKISFDTFSTTKTSESHTLSVSEAYEEKDASGFGFIVNRKLNRPSKPITTTEIPQIETETEGLVHLQEIEDLDNKYLPPPKSDYLPPTGENPTRPPPRTEKYPDLIPPPKVDPPLRPVKPSPDYEIAKTKPKLQYGPPKDILRKPLVISTTPSSSGGYDDAISFPIVPRRQPPKVDKTIDFVSSPKQEPTIDFEIRKAKPKLDYDPPRTIPKKPLPRKTTPKPQIGYSEASSFPVVPTRSSSKLNVKAIFIATRKPKLISERVKSSKNYRTSQVKPKLSYGPPKSISKKPKLKVATVLNGGYTETKSNVRPTEAYLVQKLTKTNSNHGGRSSERGYSDLRAAIASASVQFPSPVFPKGVEAFDAVAVVLPKSSVPTLEVSKVQKNILQSNKNNNKFNGNQIHRNPPISFNVAPPPSVISSTQNSKPQIKIASVVSTQQPSISYGIPNYQVSGQQQVPSSSNPSKTDLAPLLRSLLLGSEAEPPVKSISLDASALDTSFRQSNDARKLLRNTTPIQASRSINLYLNSNNQVRYQRHIPLNVAFQKASAPASWPQMSREPFREPTISGTEGDLKANNAILTQELKRVLFPDAMEEKPDLMRSVNIFEKTYVSGDDNRKHSENKPLVESKPPFFVRNPSTSKLPVENGNIQSGYDVHLISETIHQPKNVPLNKLPPFKFPKRRPGKIGFHRRRPFRKFRQRFPKRPRNPVRSSDLEPKRPLIKNFG